MRVVNISQISQWELANLAVKEESFRISKIFLCVFCGSQTNFAQTNRDGISIFCPNSSKDWHKVLMKKIRNLGDLGHPEFYRKELGKEIAEIKEKNPPTIDVQGITEGYQNMLHGDSHPIYRHLDF